jgi:hypothetical protein
MHLLAVRDDRGDGRVGPFVNSEQGNAVTATLIFEASKAEATA